MRSDGAANRRSWKRSTAGPVTGAAAQAARSSETTRIVKCLIWRLLARRPGHTSLSFYPQCAGSGSCPAAAGAGSPLHRDRAFAEGGLVEPDVDQHGASAAGDLARFAQDGRDLLH